MPRIGGVDYRDGARERLEEAGILLRQRRFGGCIYLAGRAVEGMLRGVLWQSDPDYVTGRKSLETGHSLRDLLVTVGRLNVLADDPLQFRIAANVAHVGRLWLNDLRFLPERWIKTKWFELGEIGGKRTLKKAVEEYYDACSGVIKRCEAVWHN